MNIFQLLQYVCTLTRRRHGRGVWMEKIKCVGETSHDFDKGFSQHPSVSLGWGHWPNITFHQSYLNDRQMLLHKGFFSPLTSCSTADSSESAPLNRMTETGGGEIGKRNRVRKSRQQIVADAGCRTKLEEKRRRTMKRALSLFCIRSFWINLNLCAEYFKVWATRREEEKRTSQ